jgi:hypothetical protein
VAGRVYTYRFLLLGVGDVTRTFAVPQGYRAVVRNVSAYSEGADGLVYAVVAGVLVWYWQSPGARGFTAFETRVAVYQHEQIQISKGGATVTAMCTGYLFADPTGGALPGTLPAPPAPPIATPRDE